MIRDFEALRRFENEQIRREPPDHAANLRIFEALWREAVSPRVLPLADPLEGIEVALVAETLAEFGQALERPLTAEFERLWRECGTEG